MLNCFIDNSKKMLVSLSLAGLVGCATVNLELKRDYDIYPEYRGEIALYNLDKLFDYYCFQNENIDNSVVNNEKIVCGYEGFSFRWDEIESVAIREGFLLVRGKYDSAKIPCQNTWSISKKHHQFHCDEMLEAVNICLQEYVGR